MGLPDIIIKVVKCIMEFGAAGHSKRSLWRNVLTGISRCISTVLVVSITFVSVLLLDY